jgi:hypothetical protein
MTFSVLILSWEARFSRTMAHQVGLQPVQGDFGCVLGGQDTKLNIHCLCEAKRTFLC